MKSTSSCQGIPIKTASSYFPHSWIAADGTFRQLDEAQSDASLSLVYCQNLEFLLQAIQNPNVSVIITTPRLMTEVPPAHPAGIVGTDNPRLAFFELYNKLYHGSSLRPVSPYLGDSCVIHPSAIISGETRIGNRVEIGPGAVIGSGVEIDDDVFIDANVVIGAEGLITLRQNSGALLKIKHAGGVHIKAGSMIHAGAIIAKSLFRNPTSIGRASQIGIMANIGHGASIGDNTVISGNCVVAGRSKIGHSVWIGSSCSIAQGLHVEDNAQVKMGSVVVSNVAPRSVVSGNFAVPHSKNMRHFLSLTTK